MKIKFFIIIIYIIAGLLISGLTAFMTFIIIDTPIGIKMFVQIIMAIMFVLPIIALISYFLGKYLSLQFLIIQNRLKSIEKENFQERNTNYIIKEIKEIDQSMNFLSKRLDTLIKDLKQKNQNLSDLLISMSHDIKTPLTILKGYLEEIEDDILEPEEMPKVLSSMKGEVDFLNELTVDMVGYISSMQDFKMKENINFYNFIEEEIMPIFPLNKEIAFINVVDKDFYVLFNKIDLKKICLNLVSNAFKYTQFGYIKIEIEKEKIVFENTGEEIAEEYKDKIFEPFFTISKSKNRQESGFGLGLSIVKNLSQNNGYNCYLDSQSKELVRFVLIKNFQEDPK